MGAHKECCNLVVGNIQGSVNSEELATSCSLSHGSPVQEKCLANENTSCLVKV